MQVVPADEPRAPPRQACHHAKTLKPTLAPLDPGLAHQPTGLVQVLWVPSCKTRLG